MVLLRFVVYLWWVSVSIVGIRGGVLSSEGVCNAAIESYSLNGLLLGVYTMKVVLFVGQRNSQ